MHLRDLYTTSPYHKYIFRRESYAAGSRIASHRECEIILNMNSRVPHIDNESLLSSLGADIAVPTEPATSKSLSDLVASSRETKAPASSTEERAEELLGMGIGAEQVAAALGVTPARISQLLADTRFADRVAQLRYQNLQQHNKRDHKYDQIEDSLLEKLESSVPLMLKPETILKAINVVNGAKRRGASAPEQIVNQQNIVNIMIPQVLKQRFVKNSENQVVVAGEQELVTMQASSLLKKVEQPQIPAPEAPAAATPSDLVAEGNASCAHTENKESSQN